MIPMCYYILMLQGQIQNSIRQSLAHVVWIIVLVSECASAQPPSSQFTAGQILDSKTGIPMTFEEFVPRLLGADVIYIGEEHYTPPHIQAAIRILNALIQAGKQPMLAMEMFSWDGQDALTQYVSDEIQDEEEFLQKAQWTHNWGGEFSNYKPLVEFARDHHLSLYGLNPPRSLVRKVSAKGLEDARDDAEMARWNVKRDISLNDPEYHRVLYEQLELCHPGLSDKSYQRIYEASIFRDEGMAKTIVEALHAKTVNQGPVVSYTGSGHIQYHVPVPNRVQRDVGRALQQVSVSLIAFDPSREEDIRQSLKDHIADYIWLTPLGPGGVQPKCGGR